MEIIDSMGSIGLVCWEIGYSIWTYASYFAEYKIMVTANNNKSLLDF